MYVKTNLVLLYFVEHCFCRKKFFDSIIEKCSENNLVPHVPCLLLHSSIQGEGIGLFYDRLR